MYLDVCHCLAVVLRLTSLLASDGWLILDPTEHVGKAAHLFRPGAEDVYVRSRETPRSK